MMLRVWLLAVVAAVVFAQDEGFGGMDGADMGGDFGGEDEDGRPASREEAVKQFTDILEQYDADKDGEISKAEMRVWMLSDHPDTETPPSDEEIDQSLEELMHEADRNKNGGIDINEMLHLSGFEEGSE